MTFHDGPVTIRKQFLVWALLVIGGLILVGLGVLFGLAHLDDADKWGSVIGALAALLGLPLAAISSPRDKGFIRSRLQADRSTAAIDVPDDLLTAQSPHSAVVTTRLPIHCVVGVFGWRRGMRTPNAVVGTTALWRPGPR